MLLKMSKPLQLDVKFKTRPTSEEQISLWNDIRWKRAKENMTQDTLDQYKKIGDQMLGSINFNTGENTGVPIPEPAQNSLSYIITGLKSGLLPSDLEKNEKKLLEQYIGKEWYKQYGYSKKDLDL